MKTSPRPCRHVVGRITDIGQGAEKRISAIFFQMCRRCKLDCVLGSPLEMGCLRTDQPSLDLTALWPVGKVEAAMARVVQVSGKCFGEEELSCGVLWVFVFLLLLFSFFISFFLLQIFKHERDQKRKDVSVKLNYNSIRQSTLSN